MHFEKEKNMRGKQIIIIRKLISVPDESFSNTKFLSTFVLKKEREKLPIEFKHMSKELHYGSPQMNILCPQ